MKPKAKEKAKELLDKYFIICQEFTEEIQCSIQAKQCVLIAVNEIRRLMNRLQNYEEAIYWKEVKNEIEKL
jgi:hypothetical protein